MIVTAETPGDTDPRIEVKFISRGSFVIPDTIYCIPTTLDTDKLNKLVNTIRNDGSKDFVDENFDFLVSGILLRQTLKELIEEHDILTEGTIEIECVHHEPPPVPKLSLPHDDWVGCIWHSGNNIVSGCYDSSITVWSKEGKRLAKTKEHTLAVKCLAPLHSADSERIHWISGSNDQTIRLWKYDAAEKSITCVMIGRGHERSVESIRCNGDGTRIASGGFDALLKIWNTDPNDVTTYEEVKDPIKKQRKTEKPEPMTKTPMFTLASHREGITGVCWSGNSEVITASWDQRIFVWDLEMTGVKDTLAGTKAFTSIDYSALNNLLISSSADKFVRLWDPRNKEGNLVKSTFSSHKSWVTQVRWSQTNSNLFISASYDNLMKMWDIRSPKLCLYDLSGHKDRLLCCDWSCKDYVLSGSADCTVKVFSLEGSKIKS